MKNKRIIYIILLSTILYCNNVLSEAIEGDGNVATETQNSELQADNIKKQNNISNIKENIPNNIKIVQPQTDNIKETININNEQNLDDTQAADIEEKKIKNNTTDNKESNKVPQYHEIAQKNLQQANEFLKKIAGSNNEIKQLSQAIQRSHITPSTILHILSSLQFPDNMDNEMNPGNKTPKELFLETHVSSKYIDIENMDKNISKMSLQDWILKYDELYQRKIKENTEKYDKDLMKLHYALALQVDGFLSTFQEHLSINQNQLQDSFEAEHAHLSNVANNEWPEEVKQEYIHENESVLSLAHKASIQNSRKNKETKTL